MNPENEKPQIAFFAGTWMMHTGNPYILTTVRRDTMSPPVAELFVFIQEMPSQQFRLFHAQQLNVKIDTDAIEMIPIDNIVEFAANEARNMAEVVLRMKQQEIRDKTNEAAATLPLTFTKGDWKEEMHRLRLRGMSENLLDEIGHKTKVKELAQYMEWLRNKTPTRVISL